MNVIVPDETVRGLFKYLDTDGSGDISAREFIKAFGHAISGEKAENISDSAYVSLLKPRFHVVIVAKLNLVSSFNCSYRTQILGRTIVLLWCQRRVGPTRQ